MQRKILIAVHVEPYFTDCSEDLAERIRAHADNNHYSRCILVECQSQLSARPMYFDALESFEKQTWIWGFDGEYEILTDGNNKLNVDFIESSGHPYSFIEQWMRELPKDVHYDLCGGGECECLADVRDIILFLGHSYKVLSHLVF